MEEKEINSLINNFLGGSFCQVNYKLLRFFGPESAVFISYMWDKWSFFRDQEMLIEISKDGKKLDGLWFYLYKEQIFSDIGIHLHKQTEIVKELQEIDVLNVTSYGMPKRNYYQINAIKLFELLELHSQDTLLPLVKTRCLNKSKGIVSTSQDNVSRLIIYKEDIKEVTSEEGFSKEKHSVADATQASQVDSTVLTTTNNEVDTNNQPTVAKEKKKPTRKLAQNFATPKAQKVEPIYPKELVELVSTWNALGLRKHADPTANVYKNAIKMLSKLTRAKFFEPNSQYSKYSEKKFTIKEIEGAIRRFALAATNYDYQPQNGYKQTLQKASLADFLYNNRLRKSLFIEYHENPPQLLSDSQKMIDDPDPDQTRIMKVVYAKEILGGITPNSWSDFDENCFRMASREMNTFFINNKAKLRGEHSINGDTVMHKRKRAELVMRAILHDVKDDASLIKPSWLRTPQTWDRRVPQYLFAQGIVG